MISILDVLEIPESAPGRRVEKAVKRLRRITGVSVQKATGLVEVSVLTRWPTVSAEIATRLLDGVNDFNVRSAQLQASAERSFIEERLSVAQRDLRAAEDRLEAFLRANRQFEGAPALAFQRDRLQRSVVLQQEVFTTLTKSHEEVRMREVRATPVITVVDAPEVPVLPESRQGLAMLLIGCMLFGALGSLKILEGQRRRQGANDPSDHLGQLLTEVRLAITDVTPFSRRRRQDLSE